MRVFWLHFYNNLSCDNFAVIAVIGAVTGSIAGIVDDEDEMEEEGLIRQPSFFYKVLIFTAIAQLIGQCYT